MPILALTTACGKMSCRPGGVSKIGTTVESGRSAAGEALLFDGRGDGCKRFAIDRRIRLQPWVTVELAIRKEGVVGKGGKGKLLRFDGAYKDCRAGKALGQENLPNQTKMRHHQDLRRACKAVGGQLMRRTRQAILFGSEPGCTVSHP